MKVNRENEKKIERKLNNYPLENNEYHQRKGIKKIAWWEGRE